MRNYSNKINSPKTLFNKLSFTYNEASFSMKLDNSDIQYLIKLEILLMYLQGFDLSDQLFC